MESPNQVIGAEWLPSWVPLDLATSGPIFEKETSSSSSDSSLPRALQAAACLGVESVRPAGQVVLE